MIRSDWTKQWEMRISSKGDMWLSATLWVGGRSQAQGYFEEPLEPKAVISFMPYEKMEIVALMFSIGKEILEKNVTLCRRLDMTDDNFAFNNHCVDLNDIKHYLVVE